MPDHSLAWIAFGMLVLATLALDIGVFQRKPRDLGLKEAVTWSVVWIGLALIFNIGIYFWHGGEKALQFCTGYLVELSLSLDNLFAFLLIFGYFKVPTPYRHKILSWGIFGAVSMRALFIVGGITLIGKFHWIIYVLGAFLVGSGIKTALNTSREIQPEQNLFLKVFRRFISAAPQYEGNHFFVKRRASPLFVVLLIMEGTDLVFALDSVPAVLAVTPDVFIVFTSNVFAILGLRSMFFALEGFVNRIRCTHYGFAAVLIFVGAKMLLAGVCHIPTWAFFLFIAGIFVISIIASALARPVSPTTRT